ncbi:MAG: hypothetical protein GEU74_16945 [Nitriliruptorales bacterium]|nr:hypothetical protein [Nitriliruptorales bacterium]
MTAVTGPTWPLVSRWRRALLTVHIIVSVALLGDSAGFLAVAIRSANADTTAAAVGWDTLNMFSMVFGIPLSATALLSGVALGLGTKWGVFRYPWVTTKLLLIASVMVAGTVVIGPGLEQAQRGAAIGEAQLIAGAAYDVVALSVATALSVYKPGKPSRRLVRHRPKPPP